LSWPGQHTTFLLIDLFRSERLLFLGYNLAPAVPELVAPDRRAPAGCPVPSIIHLAIPVNLSRYSPKNFAHEMQVFRNILFAFFGYFPLVPFPLKGGEGE